MIAPHLLAKQEVVGANPVIRSNQNLVFINFTKGSTMNCHNCEKLLEPVDPNHETTYQFDNALVLGLFGGYGMFVESPEYVSTSNLLNLRETGATFEIIFCHDCAHELCEKFPAFDRVVNPLKSHSHTTKYWNENPDHEGWDKKGFKGKDC